MQRTYIIFLTIFALFIGFNFYMIDYQIGMFSSANHSYLLSATIGFIGALMVIILNTIAKLKSKD